MFDIEGSAPKQNLTPRKLLYRPFALIGFDSAGEIVSFQPQGQRAVRRFMREMPVRSGLLYAGVALPNREILPGDTWTAKRYPPNVAGAVGLGIDVGQTVVCLRVARAGQRSAIAVGESLPKLLGDEGHDRMKQTQQAFEYVDQSTPSSSFGRVRSILRLQHRFR